MYSLIYTVSISKKYNEYYNENNGGVGRLTLETYKNIDILKCYQYKIIDNFILAYDN